MDLDVEAITLSAQLWATFEIDDLRRFATDFFKSLKTAKAESSTDLLEDVLARVRKTRDSVENLTIRGRT